MGLREEGADGENEELVAGFGEEEKERRVWH